MATTKVRITARLRPILRGEFHDDGVRVCHAEPRECSTTSGANASSSANSSSSASGALNASGSSSGSRSGSGPFTGIAVANPRDASQVFRFPFTSCYDADATQTAIFDTDVRPLVDVAWGGVTVTIFAYGVTSSGKTHTMQGTGADPGIIPRVVEALFAKTAATTQIETAEFAVSYMEIYKDDVYDLLVAREDAPKLPVRENDAGAVFVAGLTETPIASAVEFKEVYDTAAARRSVGATLLNRASSRSHAVLTLTMRRVTVATNGGGGRTKEVLGKLNLVDLAGSENNKLTGNDPSRMAESSAINMSLLVLGQVVHALNTGASCVPYRNAKLTHILQDALSGSSVGLLICNLAPSTKFRLDTLNTLNFAARMKNIKNKPMVDKRDLRPPRPPAPVPPKLDLAAQPPAPKPLISFALPPPNRAGARPSLVPRPVDADGHGVPDVQPTEAEAAHVSDDQMEVDKVETSLTGRTAFGFGQELTNTGSKRALALAVDARMETTTKRPKRSGSPKKLRVINIESDKKDEFVPDSAFRDDGAMNGDTDDDTPVQRSQTQSNISLASPSKQPTRVMELDPGQCPECQQKGAKLTAQHLCDANHAASFTETLYKKRSKHVVKLFRELADLHFVCACGERFRSIADGRTHFEILRKDRDNTHSLGFATGPSQGTHFVKNIWKKKASKSLNEDSRD